MSNTAVCLGFPSNLNSFPVDKTAALVGFFPGENWSPLTPPKSGTVLEISPISHPKRNIEKYAHASGVRRGKLTAVSFWHVKKNHKTVWLMRCDCGCYCFRHIRRWLESDVFDQCLNCETATKITRPSTSRSTHGVRFAKWQIKMQAKGFTKEESLFIREYGLSADDLVWLRAVVNEFFAKKGGAA